MRYEEANLDGVDLEALGNGIYTGTDGKKYRLANVDREFPGRRLKPVYFLQRERGGVMSYVSGVFKTKREGVYSIDVKDDLGVKHYYDMEKAPGRFHIIARRAPEKTKIESQDLFREKAEKHEKADSVSMGG